ncbi:MAG: hypothetical protein CVV44_10110 [Spirochaetae bacterium HGW-Spirochaetae-1]|nr:MAG: hypothetical protein CVV44_10110 [Spirochaetae bacterium HGW-Spirochaetae-1]
MKRMAGFISICILSLYITGTGRGNEEAAYQSKIISVKLYQNQAEITRTASVSLVKGQNMIVLSTLPELLYDWSVKGSLPRDFPGKILSLEVEKKALIKKKQTRILEIEEKLEKLREQDQVFVDDLKNIKSQEEFLDSILKFTDQTVSKELATRIPQVKVWDDTLGWVVEKKKKLLNEKRSIEKNREKIGKEIQNWEFELSQIAGYSYFETYRSLNQAVSSNKSSMAVQQFNDITTKYAERRKLFTGTSGKVDIEKRVIISIFSPTERSVEVTVSYVIPNTYWNMLYDVRASREKGDINLVIYGNIFQNTGEDWKDITLALSTGSPVNTINPPVVQPWYLDIVEDRDEYAGGASNRSFRAKKAEKMDFAASESVEEKEGAPALLPETTISEKGPYLDLTLPLKQSILSSAKYQKKFIKDYAISGADNVRFYYEVIPSQITNSFLRVETSNSTALPWLQGEAQLFLENEFMGKVAMPFTPVGKKEDIVLGMEPRITAKKELVKKYEDTAGVFGGNRRILYIYKIVVENQIKANREIVIVDNIPVSRNKKIQVEVANLSHPFMKDGVFEKTTDYAQGIRKWKMEIGAGKKVEITYDITVSFDKDTDVSGL